MLEDYTAILHGVIGMDEITVVGLISKIMERYDKKRANLQMKLELRKQ